VFIQWHNDHLTVRDEALYGEAPEAVSIGTGFLTIRPSLLLRVAQVM
jgi:hypothetical protein